MEIYAHYECTGDEFPPLSFSRWAVSNSSPPMNTNMQIVPSIRLHILSQYASSSFSISCRVCDAGLPTMAAPPESARIRQNPPESSRPPRLLHSTCSRGRIPDDQVRIAQAPAAPTATGDHRYEDHSRRCANTHDPRHATQSTSAATRTRLVVAGPCRSASTQSAPPRDNRPFHNKRVRQSHRSATQLVEGPRLVADVNR
jgi:hypothetical protein